MSEIVNQLKALKLHGFKSFADATTLRFEPGVTAIVGELYHDPNSGL